MAHDDTVPWRATGTTSSMVAPEPVVLNSDSHRALKEGWVFRCLNDYRKGCYKTGFPSHIDLNEVWGELSRSQTGPDLSRHTLYRSLSHDLHRGKIFRRPEDRSWRKIKSRGGLPGWCKPAIIFGFRALNYADTKKDTLPGNAHGALVALGLERILEDPTTWVLDPFWEGAEFYNPQWVAQNCTSGRGWTRGLRQPPCDVNRFLRCDFLQGEAQRKGKRHRSGAHEDLAPGMGTSPDSPPIDWENVMASSSSERFGQAGNHSHSDRQVPVMSREYEGGNDFEELERSNLDSDGSSIVGQHTWHTPSTSDATLDGLRHELDELKSTIEHIVGGEDDEVVAAMKNMQAQIDRTDKNLRTQIGRMDTRLQDVVSRLCHLEGAVGGNRADMTSQSQHSGTSEEYAVGGRREVLRPKEGYAEVSDLDEAKNFIKKLQKELGEVKAKSAETQIKREAKREASYPASVACFSQPLYQQQYQQQAVYGYQTPHSSQPSYPPQSYLLPPPQTNQPAQPHLMTPFTPAPQLWPWMGHPGAQITAPRDLSIPPSQPTRVKREGMRRDRREELQVHGEGEDEY
ncbi:hypothetical protein B0T16DRAFT_21187 [Cercophora newfieldiana]|uniref:Uncharacterized protein n=1 Tax=Cercophora newfieldiana TaxID=92897 RepID=A0AA40D0B9_9PEZI|nr:hypothetical protein B0T16DRAFT_21187 [Cercophora newfieldiana]